MNNINPMSASVQEINDLRKENMSLKRKVMSLEIAQDIESYKKLARDAWLDEELVGEREKVKELSQRVKVLEDEAKIYWLQQQLAKSRAAAVELKKQLTQAESDVSHESEWRRQWKEKAVQSRVNFSKLQKQLKEGEGSKCRQLEEENTELVQQMKGSDKRYRQIIQNRASYNKDLEAQLEAAEEREQKLQDKLEKLELEGGDEQEEQEDIVPGSPEQMKWFNGLSVAQMENLRL